VKHIYHSLLLLLLLLLPLLLLPSILPLKAPAK
jgi:hypothetical protein